MLELLKDDDDLLETSAGVTQTVPGYTEKI